MQDTTSSQKEQLRFGDFAESGSDTDAPHGCRVVQELREQTFIDPAEYPQQDPETCLSFTIDSSWGHFRRVEGNVVADTYGIPPRTTITGLLSAILGFKRNSYYQVFGGENSKISIELRSDSRTMSIPELILATSSKDSDVRTIPSSGKLGLKLPDPSKDRKRKNYEVLVNPSYRINVWVSTKPVYNALQYMLETGKSYYTPAMGKSEYLANITYHGEHDITTTVNTSETSDDRVRIDSVAPIPAMKTIPTPDTQTRTEKLPFLMEQEQTKGYTKRRTTDFKHVTYNPRGGHIMVPETNSLTVSRVNSRNVVFL